MSLSATVTFFEFRHDQFPICQAGPNDCTECTTITLPREMFSQPYALNGGWMCEP